MGGHKTLDGIRLGDILRVALEAGIGYRTGKKHPYQLERPGMRPCPIATSTHAYRMVTPWMAEATGRGRQEIYESLRCGFW